jgi:IclR family transcriptional regulator, acetate operon repressor
MEFHIMKRSFEALMTSSSPAGARSSAVTGTQAVDRACGLVSLVVQADEPMTFTEISDETGLARSTTSRLLSALERTDLLQRDDNGGYVAGSLFALYAARHDPWQEAARIARPHLEQLRDRTGETAHLGVPRGGSVLHIAQVDSAYLLATRDWTETNVPEHCSSLGKVLYAYGCLPFPAGPLERRTERTVTDVAALKRELVGIRRRGYAVSVDELEVGLTALAAPVRGRDGDVIAALGISGPTARLQDRVDQVGRLLGEQADELSALLRRRTHKEGAA